jgi:tetratricopeptide (TPR) repeat protein
MRASEALVACAITVGSLAYDQAVARDATWRQCELARRKPDRSIAACSKILAQPSARAHAAAFHNRGIAYAAKGDLDRALSDISAGIRLDPRRAYRWQERGEIYTRRGDYDRAIADLTEAIRIDPTRAFRFHARATAYRASGNFLQAILDYSEAIRLDPVPRAFRFSDRGNALRDAGQYERALADYQTAVKLEPKNGLIYLERGRAHAKISHFHAAKRDFDAAIAADPANLELRSAVDQELSALAAKKAIAAPSRPNLMPPEPPKQVAPATKPDRTSSGSAFVVSRRGHLLTNNHVVSDCTIVDVA